MSEDDSRGEEDMKDKEEGDTDSGEKTEEETGKEEEDEEEEEKKEPPPPKKRGRKPRSAAPAAAAKPPAKKAKKEKEPEPAAKKKRKPVKKHPKTMDMVVEAIDNLGEMQGSSVQAIKSYIVQNFKTVRIDMVKSMLRRSLTMGLQQGIVARPKAQANTQVMCGRYLLGNAAKTEDEDEVMPQQSKRAQEAKISAKISAKKLTKKVGKKVVKKSPKKPVARKASPPKAKRPVKKTRRGRK